MLGGRQQEYNAEFTISDARPAPNNNTSKTLFLRFFDRNCFDIDILWTVVKLRPDIETVLLLSRKDDVGVFLACVYLVFLCFTKAGLNNGNLGELIHRQLLKQKMRIKGGCKELQKSASFQLYSSINDGN